MEKEEQTRSVIGAQLYTIREHTQTLPDIEKSLQRIREIGYEAIQISAFGQVNTRDVAKIVEDCGLTVAATHMGWPVFLEQIDYVIETHHLWNCRHTAIGSLGRDKDYYSLDGLSRFIDELGPVTKKLSAAGLDFSYHNHSHELVRLEGKTWLERLYEQTNPDDLKAEIDVYWITAGGGDPAHWIRKIGRRQPLVHLKDMAVLADRTQRFTEVGEGNLNWPRLLEACRQVGVEWHLVEQDNCYESDPFDCLQTSLKNLRALGLI